MNLLHSDGYVRPFGGKASKEPVDVVCVDGTEGGDRAMRFALNETPPDHRLLLLWGGYVPHQEELHWGAYSVTSMREGHHWDRDLPDIYNKYMGMCDKAGVHLPSPPAVHHDCCVCISPHLWCATTAAQV
jgi:hypothetical protein